MNLDVLIFEQINGWAGKSDILDAAGIFFAEYFQYIFGIALIWLFRRNIKAIILSVGAAVLAKFGIAGLIRFFWARQRPFIENHVNLLVDKGDEPSFPSGHAAFFFGLSTVIYSYNKKAGTIAFIASSLISISRVFVGVHWPLDIVAGAAVGIISGWLVIKLLKRS